MKSDRRKRMMEWDESWNNEPLFVCSCVWEREKQGKEEEDAADADASPNTKNSSSRMMNGWEDELHQR
jgi:hypothetical protein